MITLNKDLSGKILDVGGGGEGIIGRLYGEQVTAIDKYQEELDEAPSGFVKVLMDAVNLTFSDCSFDHATFFYSLMFMSAEEQRRAIMEAVRVLKCGGEIHIWDCEIASAYPEPFCVDVQVQLRTEQISTTYGIGKLDAQDKTSIQTICENAGLQSVTERVGEEGFYLCFKKISHHNASL